MRNFIHYFREGGEGSEGAHSTNYRDLAVRSGLWAQNFVVLLGNKFIFLLYKISVTDENHHSADDILSHRV